MWVGGESDVEGIREQWPCPDRVLNAPEFLLKSVRSSAVRSLSEEPTLNAMREGAKTLLQNAVGKITGLNRWSCSKAKWDLDLSHNKDAQ